MYTVALYNEESNNKDSTNNRAPKVLPDFKLSRILYMTIQFPATIHIVVPAVQYDKSLELFNRTVGADSSASQNGFFGTLMILLIGFY